MSHFPPLSQSLLSLLLHGNICIIVCLSCLAGCTVCLWAALRGKGACTMYTLRCSYGPEETEEQRSFKGRWYFYLPSPLADETISVRSFLSRDWKTHCSLEVNRQSGYTEGQWHTKVSVRFPEIKHRACGAESTLPVFEQTTCHTGSRKYLLTYWALSHYHDCNRIQATEK